MKKPWKQLLHLALAGVPAACFLALAVTAHADHEQDAVAQNVQNLMETGRQTFRFDTFGDEAYWGDTLKLHRAIEGAAFGGVGQGVSPATALAVGLKVDAGALPESVVAGVRNGSVNLNSPATTLDP